VLERGREVFKLQRVLAVTTPDNHHSIGLLKKAGFKYERMIRLGDDAEELKLFGSNGDGGEA
jgi:RimJ/RimL family protein N-acetyltransferase